MTRDDIISMAKEAGYGWSLADIHAPALERFAALVISQHVKETRPEVSDSMATWLQQIAYQHGGIGDLSRTEMEFGAMVAAAEREACAKVCEAEAEKWEGNDGPICFEARLCAVNIRARGEK